MVSSKGVGENRRISAVPDLERSLDRGGAGDAVGTYVGV